MSLHIAVGKQGPPVGIGVLPALVPGRLGEFAARSVDCLDGGPVADTVVVRGDAHDGAVSAMETHVVFFEVTPSYAVKVPELGQPGEKGPWDGGKRAQNEGCIEEMKKIAEDPEGREEKNEIHVGKEDNWGVQGDKNERCERNQEE